VIKNLVQTVLERIVM